MQSLMEALSADNIKFQEDWLEYTHYGIDHMPWETYLKNYWAPAKEPFLGRVFKGKLIHKFPFRVVKSRSDLVQCIANNGNIGCFRDEFNDFLYNKVVYHYLKCHYHLPSSQTRVILNYYNVASWKTKELLAQYGIDREIIQEDESSWGTNLRDLVAYLHAIPTTEFADNCCSANYSLHLPESSKIFKISSGQKPIKAMTSFLKYITPFCGSWSEELLQEGLRIIEQLRIYISQELNTKYLSGQLCLSIHPMDYMTMSDNGCGWNSCMRWLDNGGEYHAGTLEMMTSSSVVLAYLESDTPWYPMNDGRQWTNKKWRELFIVDKNFISCIKGYPYRSESMEDAVLYHLMDMMENIGISFDRTICRSDDYQMHLPNSERATTFSTELMYNDTGYTTLAYVFKNGLEEYDLPSQFSYGEGAYCINCGSLRTNDNSSGAEGLLVCEDCDGKVVCACCEERFYPDEYNNYRTETGEWICESCFENHYVQSDITEQGGYDWELDLVTLEIELQNNKGHYSYLTINMEREIFDTIPEECVQCRTWDYNDFSLVQPLPEEGIDTRLQKYLYERLNSQDSYYFRGHYRPIYKEVS